LFEALFVNKNKKTYSELFSCSNFRKGIAYNSNINEKLFSFPDLAQNSKIAPKELFSRVQNRTLSRNTHPPGTGSALGICGVFELFLSNYILKIPTKSLHFTQFQPKNISNTAQIPYFHIQKHTTSDNA